MIFYTSITNGYDRLESPPVTDARFVCFYDGDKPKVEGYEYIKLEIDEECPVSKSYHPKHRPDLYFDANECTVWFDACYTISDFIVNLSRELFDKNDFVMQKHPDARTLFAEFQKLYECGFSTKNEILEMCKRIKEIGYPIKYYDQTINSLIWRKLTVEIIDWCKLWREWYDLGVNRDQISSSIAEYLMSVRYKSPLSFKIHRVPIKLEMGKRINRLKDYKESYNLHTNPTVKERIDFIDEIRSIFYEKSELLFSNKLYACVKYTPFEMNKHTDPKDMIVYTCITNGYDQFPKGNYYHPDVRYVCFHDGTVDTSVEPWEYIDIRDYHDEECPRRLSFYPKANPHLFFPDGSNTIWIDGCYRHTFQFIKRSTICFPFTMLRHASKFSYFDEMLEGFTCAFFSYDDAIQLTKKLKDTGYNFRTYASPLGTIVWRTLSPEMKKFNESWYKWSLIGCNRDQISYDMALKESGIKLPSVLERRTDSGVPLGYYNKVGRKGMHPQRGDIKQYLRKDELLNELSEITGLNHRLYTEYPDHEFYMGKYNII